MGGLFTGLVTAALTLAYAFITSLNSRTESVIIAGVVGFLIGIAEFSIIAAVIDSGVTTTFVCLAEDPAALARTKPELYQQIQAVYPNVVLGF